MEAQELNRQLNRLIEGSIETEDFQRVQDLLRRDREARQAYYDLLGVDMMLGELYEAPDHITVHSQAMDDSWALRRAKRGMLAWSVIGAAAVLMISLGTLFLFKTRPPEVQIAASADSHFYVNGETGSEGLLEPDDSLVLDHGVVSLTLGPYVEACIDGPARLRLMDRDGHLELLEGTAFFQISNGSEGYEVHTPAGIIHDIGTKFGVRVHPGGKVETHVTSGAVEINREDGEARYRVEAGEAVHWTSSDPIRRTMMDADLFVQSLPWQHVLLRDDFSEEDDTPLSGKSPDLGKPWRMSLDVTPPTVVKEGKIDTSFGPRTMSAGFLDEPSNNRRRVYLASLTTAVPANIEDKSSLADGAESITLWTREGRPLVSLTASAIDQHRWHLENERAGTATAGIRLSALEANTLTLSYDRESGLARLYEGPDTSGPLLDQMNLPPGETPVSMSISNAQGGDVAIDDLDVRVVAYPQPSQLRADND